MNTDFPDFLPFRCETCGGTLRRIEHPANTPDDIVDGKYEYYQVFWCEECGSYEGCRFQFHPGTGSDDHWIVFGKDAGKIHRHYT